MKLPDLTLQDDGSLDTVFHCETCGLDLRFCHGALDRDESGALTDEGFKEAQELHDDECAEEVGVIPRSPKEAAAWDKLENTVSELRTEDRGETK